MIKKYIYIFFIVSFKDVVERSYIGKSYIRRAFRIIALPHMGPLNHIFKKNLIKTVTKCYESVDF